MLHVVENIQVCAHIVWAIGRVVKNEMKLMCSLTPMSVMRESMKGNIAVFLHDH